MTKAVFFDWFNTLAEYEPPRYQLHRQACHESGIELSPEQVKRGILAADRYFFDENARSPVEKRSQKEKAAFYQYYQEILLNEAGTTVSKQQLPEIMGRIQQLFAGTTWALFDDVLPTLKTLKERGLILGLLTNLSQDMEAVFDRLDLKPYLSFAVTSGEAGADKPQPPIFLMALERAKVTASEAVHVGDQYNIDVAGARRVGIQPVLLDRFGQYPEVTDCPRIRTLPDIVNFL
ncbi:HAD family hydrolase [Chloroflexota bacterium]